MPAQPSTPVTLNPHARILWRTPTAVQIELGERMVILDGISTDDVTRLLDRTSPHHTDLHPTKENGTDEHASVGESSAQQVMNELARAGFMVETATAATHPGPPRLESELGALRVRHGSVAAQLLAARAQASVVISGGNRLGPMIASTLAVAGVGNVSVSSGGTVRLRYCGPGGLEPHMEGQPYAQATAEVLHRAAPEVRTPEPRTDARPDLVIIADEGPADTEVSAALLRDRQSHLLAQAGAERAAVGPLVIPGLTSCVQCTELHRRDRDRAWHALAAQLALTPRFPAGDTALATLTAGLAAWQALAYLDGQTVTVIDASLEILWPDWRIRRRSWPRHPACECSRTATPAEHDQRPSAPRGPDGLS